MTNRFDISADQPFGAIDNGFLRERESIGNRFAHKIFQNLMYKIAHIHRANFRCPSLVQPEHILAVIGKGTVAKHFQTGLGHGKIPTEQCLRRICTDTVSICGQISTGNRPVLQQGLQHLPLRSIQKNGKQPPPRIFRPNHGKGIRLCQICPFCIR